MKMIYEFMSAFLCCREMIKMIPINTVITTKEFFA